jgi:hypothetical protein
MAIKLDATSRHIHCRQLLFSYSGIVKPSWRFAGVNVKGRYIIYAMSLVHLSPPSNGFLVLTNVQRESMFCNFPPYEPYLPNKALAKKL